MDRYKRLLGEEWNIISAGGLTGEAYVAEKQNKRLFLKRNSSPFLAVLSAEGLVPKLIWTKRMENGDVVTAQEWIEGRALFREEMQETVVANLIYKIHHSSELLYMLRRMGQEFIPANVRLHSLKAYAKSQQMDEEYNIVKQTLRELTDKLPILNEEKQVVCHGDLNHNNLIKSIDNEIYLIDWDNTRIADPLSDIAIILENYVPMSNWSDWLKQYGYTLNRALFDKIFWYIKADVIYYILWSRKHNRMDYLDKCLKKLDDLNIQSKQSIFF